MRDNPQMSDDAFEGEPTDWSNGLPFSPRFQDRYFDAAGVAESAHVFLQHNQLPDRWATSRRFTVAELGFGTGLNACLTFDTWMRHAPRDATLDYVSVEGFPLSPADMLRTASQWPGLDHWMRTLAGACEQLKPGFNLRVLAGGRIRLLLLVGEVQPMLDALDASVDAWYLDGFAPSRNPAMWSDAVCHAMAGITRPGGTFATYTAAGWVRRNLESAGFVVTKAPGFGRKREMLCGHRPAAVRAPEPAWPAWFRRPTATSSSAVSIVGGGLAGAATARALAERGFRVTVYDDPAPARAAPSRLAGLILRPYPDRASNLRGHFYDTAFAHATHRLTGAAGWHPTGVAVLDVQGRIRSGAIDAHDLSQRVGRKLDTGGQWIPDAGWLAPKVWTQSWLDHLAIERISRRWLPADTAGAEPCVLATGAAASPWDAAHPVSLSRGQMSSVRCAHASTDQPAMAGGGLCIPQSGELVVGASHVRGSEASQPSPEEAEGYLTEWSNHLPGAFDREPASAAHAAAIRAGTTDRMPQVGPVPDRAWWAEQYADLRHGRPHQTFPAARYEPGQWLHRGHGSRGATAALLCGEVIAAALAGAPLPVDATTWAALHPGRQLVQALRRGELL